MTVLLLLTFSLCALIAFMLVLDIALHQVLRRSAGVLPSDIVGPEGWLIDTTRNAGIFNRS